MLRVSFEVAAKLILTSQNMEDMAKRNMEDMAALKVEIERKDKL